MCTLSFAGAGVPSWPSEKHQLREGAVLSGCEGIQTLSWPVEPTGCEEQMAQAWLARAAGGDGSEQSQQEHSS